PAVAGVAAALAAAVRALRAGRGAGRAARPGLPLEGLVASSSWPSMELWCHGRRHTRFCGSCALVGSHGCSLAGLACQLRAVASGVRTVCSLAGQGGMGAGNGLANKKQAPNTAQSAAAGAGRFDECPGASTWHGGRKKNGEQGVGRSRGGNTSKIHLVSDGGGNVLGWQVRAGQAGDAPEAADLLAPWLAPAQEVLGDAAYDSDALRAVIAEAGAIAVIKPNPRRKNKPHFDPLAYQKRHHIEQTF
nr:hypothetical protein [Tanacetum cinerariifolium]